MINSKRLLFIFIFFIFSREIVKAQDQSYKNFYGISWRGKAHDNLLYACNMGYKYVFYQKGMENDSLSNGLSFYIESPEYLIYKRGINLRGSYTAKDIDFYEKYCTVVNPQLPFPSNLATGWFFSDSIFSAELDFEKKDVIEWTVQEIFKHVKTIEQKNNKFKFAGFAWDVPQLTGDFWSSPTQKGGKQVTLAYWNINDAKRSPDRQNNYVLGRIQYYQVLFSTMRKQYPDAKTIMEPNKIYEDWIKNTEKYKVPNSIMPDILCQESSDWKFIEDSRILKNGLIKKDQLISTSPNVFGEEENRIIAGQMAINGAWFSWFGRFGGTGNMPNYLNIYEVPDRLKLIRVIANWENLNKTPLEKRVFQNDEYTSPTAGISKNVLWGINPTTKDIICVFLSTTGSIPIAKNKKIKVFLLDKFMGKDKDGSKFFKIIEGKIYLKDSTLLEKTFSIKIIK